MSNVNHDEAGDSLAQTLAILDPAEEMWRDTGPLLKAHGYRLRPRYQPGWTASWQGQDVDFEYCEDSCTLPVSTVFLIVWLF